MLLKKFRGLSTEGGYATIWYILYVFIIIKYNGWISCAIT